MKRHENGIWILLNANNLPRVGTNKNRINHKECVGMTLVFKHKGSKQEYEIKIIDYINGYKDENSKRTMSKFKVEYIYLKGTVDEEIIKKDIDCNHLINNAKIGGIIPSFNQWTKKEGYWEGKDTKGREFKFSTKNKETEYKILHSTWSINSDAYVFTNNLSSSGQIWKMHKAIYFNCNKEESHKSVHMCIDHINNDRTDNRVENLRLVSKTENNKNRKTNNKYGLVGLQRKNKGYYSKFGVEGYTICTRIKYDLEEVKIDNLIAQRYLGLKHNDCLFYKLEDLPEERIKEVVELLEEKIEKNRNKIKKEKEYKYNFIEKGNLIGIRTYKKDGTENPICWIDKDFGKIINNKYVINGTICNDDKGYFLYTINRKNYKIYNYILTDGVSLQNYRNNNFHIDHINQKINENYRANLEIVTPKSNMMNKKSKRYYKRGNRYEVHYASNWNYFNLYIGGLKTPIFNTEEEAITEVKRRKEIVNKYRFRIGWQGSKEDTMKALDEVIDFSEKHKLDLDSAYIVCKGLDTEDNIKNYLNILTNK